MRLRAALFSIAGLLLWFTVPNGAYSLSGERWPSGSIVMNLQQGSSGSLIDGSTNWDAVTEGALATWNPFLNGVSFRAATNASAGVSSRNGVNNVAWADDMYGDAFGDAVAVTVYLYRGTTMVEADVLFDRGRNWNSYRGNLRRGSDGKTLYDLRRVALHEFGHVLGLDHPDDHNQSVTAIMNSRVSNVDSLQTDDTNGVRAIYGAPAAAPVFRDRLLSGARLLPGQQLTSLNGRYRLAYQADGNLVLYDDVNRDTPWSSGTAGTSAGQAVMQTDGNFVVYDAQIKDQWVTGTTGNPNARLQVNDDGNVVVYKANDEPAWSRF
jgi:predicted Zn-dependent protease